MQVAQVDRVAVECVFKQFDAFHCAGVLVGDGMLIDAISGA
jgi:hypothetical protein